MKDGVDVSTSERTRAQLVFAALIVAFVTVSIFYKVLRHEDLGHSSAMFLGIPGLLALLLALAPRPKSATGVILRGIVIALLLVAPLLGEGYLCILFASPLFLGVGLVVGLVMDHSRARRSSTLSCIAFVLLAMSMEGVLPRFTHERAQTAEATEVVEGSASEVEAALSRSPRVHEPLPRFLRIGFPRPLSANGSGLTLGAMRAIRFGGAEGDPPGDLVMRVAEVRPGYVRFEMLRDSSKLTQWVRWQSSEVTYKGLDPSHTRVEWRIGYQRELDPFWYFAPWEHVAVRQAARYLITANAAPPKS